MIERQLTLPARPDEVWDALVEPEILRDWFGADVTWKPTPGSALQAVEEDGSVREGFVKSVSEGDHLQFEWWPTDDTDSVSEVTYTLTATEDDETVLTVTERQTSSMDAQMSAVSWTTTDDALFRIWAAVAMPTVVV